MKFSKDNRFLALVSTSFDINSEEGTLHLFDLNDPKIYYSKRIYWFNL